MENEPEMEEQTDGQKRPIFAMYENYEDEGVYAITGPDVSLYELYGHLKAYMYSVEARLRTTYLDADGDGLDFGYDGSE